MPMIGYWKPMRSTGCSEISAGQDAARIAHERQFARQPIEHQDKYRKQVQIAQASKARTTQTTPRPNSRPRSLDAVPAATQQQERLCAHHAGDGHHTSHWLTTAHPKTPKSKSLACPGFPASLVGCVGGCVFHPGPVSLAPRSIAPSFHRFCF
jgi:hypothetical protein